MRLLFEEGMIQSWVRAELTRRGKKERVNGKARPRHVLKLTWPDEERTETLGRNDTAICQTKGGKNKRYNGKERYGHKPGQN